jgi:hypothetical protein
MHMRVGVRHVAVAVLVLVLRVLVLVRRVGVGVGDVAMPVLMGMRPVVLVLAHRLPPVGYAKCNQEVVPAGSVPAAGASAGPPPLVMRPR